MPGPVHDLARIVRHVRGRDVSATPVRCRDDLTEPVVALTFDDGPDEWTEPILDALRDAGAHATFFVIGEAIHGNEPVLERIRAEGHEIGNHTMTHPRLDTVSRRTIASEIRRGSKAIEQAIGEPPTAFRPPGFGYNVAVLEEAYSAGFDRVVLASVATDDFLRDSADDIVEAIAPRLRPGAIVDLHDGRTPREPAHGDGASRADRWPTVRAVELLIGALPEFAFVTASELLAR